MSISKMMRNMVIGAEAGLALDIQEAASANRSAMRTMRALEADIEHQNKELDRLDFERFDNDASSRAATAIIRQMAAVIAELRGEPIESVQAELNQARSREYDRLVDDYLRDGTLRRDPRTGVTPRVAMRSWYTPDTGSV